MFSSSAFIPCFSVSIKNKYTLIQNSCVSQKVVRVSLMYMSFYNHCASAENAKWIEWMILHITKAQVTVNAY